MVERVQLPTATGRISFGRRITTLSEVIEYEEYRTIAKWDPINDAFQTFLKDSEQLQKIAVKTGLSFKGVLEEIQHRALLIRDLRERGITQNAEISKFITNYYVETQQAKAATLIKASGDKRKGSE